ncbi:MAG: trehalose-phosphatase [Candidatus Micrarchaeota archaeon]
MAARKIQSKKALLVLDFDGTLVPIRRNPKKVRLPLFMARALRNAWRNGLDMTVLSGRPPSFLRRAGFGFPIRLIGHFGNTHPAGTIRWKNESALHSILERLRKIPGVRIEKKTGWAVHFRQVRPARRPAVLRLICSLGSAAGPTARLVPGRLSCELLPPGSRTKADALGILLRRHPARRIVFIGDDPADLEAMRRWRHHPRFEAFLLHSPEVSSGGWPPRLADRRALAGFIRAFASHPEGPS